MQVATGLMAQHPSQIDIIDIIQIDPKTLRFRISLGRIIDVHRWECRMLQPRSRMLSSRPWRC